MRRPGDQGEGHDHSNHQRGDWLGAPKNFVHFVCCWRSGLNTHDVALAAPTDGETMLDVGAGMGAGTLVAARIPGARVECREPSLVMRTILKSASIGPSKASIDHRARSRC